MALEEHCWFSFRQQKSSRQEPDQWAIGGASDYIQNGFHEYSVSPVSRKVQSCNAGSVTELHLELRDSWLRNTATRGAVVIL